MKYQVSFPAKTSCLHMWRYHRRYGYIVNRAFESKRIWYFTGVYTINRILHTRLWIWILSSRVQLDISLVPCVCQAKCSNIQYCYIYSIQSLFIQFNSIFIQFNPYSFYLIPIVIQFNLYSFNSIFRSIQFNLYIGSI